MNEARKKHLIFSLLMAFFAGSTVVFVSVSVNNGFNSLFFQKWMRGLALSYIVLVPFIFFIAPVIQKLAVRIFEKWFNA